MNRLIDILTTNQKENVLLSWTHLVSFQERPSTGAQGVMGVKGPATGYFGCQGSIGMVGASAASPHVRNGKNYIMRSVPRTQLPETLQFSIQFRSKSLFEEFFALLEKNCPNVENSVSISVDPPVPLRKQQRLKQEFVELAEEKKKQFDMRVAKVSLLLEMAFDLGLKLYDEWSVDERNDLVMPMEAYEEYGEQMYRDGVIRILCRSNTDIYKALDSAGLLQAYCPSDYRCGAPYSVNGGPMHIQPVEEVEVE